MNDPLLRRRRRDLGLTQTELGALLDVQTATISGWETGTIAMRHPTVIGLALQTLERDWDRLGPEAFVAKARASVQVVVLAAKDTEAWDEG